MKISIHQVTDPETLLSWRKEVIKAVFGMAPTESLMEANREYYMKHVPEGSHIALQANVAEHAAGCGAICLGEELPSPDNPGGRCAYLMNIYVRREYRGHGIGHAIVRELVGKAQELGCDKIYLETTGMARSMYQGIGFRDFPDMMKFEYLLN